MARKKKKAELVDRCCNDRCGRHTTCALFNAGPPGGDRSRIRYIRVDPDNCNRFIRWVPGEPLREEGR